MYAYLPVPRASGRQDVCIFACSACPWKAGCMHIENAVARPPHLGFWCVGVAFGVMLWFLKLFACRYDGEAPQEHLYLGLLAYSQRGVRPLSQVVGLAWLSLNGYVSFACVSFVSMFFLLARVGAIWWPLCKNICLRCVCVLL